MSQRGRRGRTPCPIVELLAIAAAQPLRTSTGVPPRPADVINLVFSSSEAALQHSFNTAGWNTAVALGLRADVKTVLAVAVDRGYRLGPVSLQSLNGRPPDHVFQKQTNTFNRPACAHSASKACRSPCGLGKRDADVVELALGEQLA